MKRYPKIVDTNRLSEKKDRKPADYWNYHFFEGFWYHQLSSKQIQKMVFLESVERDFGLKFDSCDAFCEYVHNEIESSEVEHTCKLCGFKTISSTRLENHVGSKNCEVRQKRNACREKGEVYIPDCKQPAKCFECNLTFRNKYVLEKHKKTKKHLRCVQCTQMPHECKICDKNFEGKNSSLRFRRHLKNSKKCHKMCVEDPVNLKLWNMYYKKLNCKFSKACVNIHDCEKNIKIISV